MKWTDNIYNTWDNLTINSQILGLKIKDESSKEEIPIKDLNETIRIELPILNYNPLMRNQKLACVYWNTSKQAWSDEGCTYIGIEKRGQNYLGVCLCNHLTDFSISGNFGNLIKNSGFQYLGDIEGSFAAGNITTKSGKSIRILLIK